MPPVDEVFDLDLAFAMSSLEYAAFQLDGCHDSLGSKDYNPWPVLKSLRQSR